MKVDPLKMKAFDYSKIKEMERNPNEVINSKILLLQSLITESINNKKKYQEIINTYIYRFNELGYDYTQLDKAPNEKEKNNNDNNNDNKENKDENNDDIVNIKNKTENNKNEEKKEDNINNNDNANNADNNNNVNNNINNNTEEKKSQENIDKDKDNIVSFDKNKKK